MSKTFRRSVLTALIAMMGVVSFAQTVPEISAQPSPAEIDARRWFQDAKFGLFIHWGIYSELGAGEWVMETHKIPIRDYEKLAHQFYPVRYDPAKWVAIAKASGMKYITITSRHHDGFSMFKTKQTDWNIVDRTPYARDPLRMLADECHRQGIKLFFYYSQLDWHHPDYFPRGNTGKAAGRPESGDWNRYIDFMNAQLTELLTNYGEIGGIWFDGMWDKPDADWQLDRTYRLIHKLQRQALIIPNHHKKPLPGEDVQTFERDLPGENKSGFSAAAEIGDLPFETSDTVNQSWGFNLTDDAYKTPKQLIEYLVNAAGRNANLLLNVGPMPNGEFPPEAVANLHQVGKWLEKNGESIFGTRGGPVAPQSWGVTTTAGDRIFVHVLNGSRHIDLPGLTNVCAAYELDGHRMIDHQASADGLKLVIPPPRSNEDLDRVVVLERNSSHPCQ